MLRELNSTHIDDILRLENDAEVRQFILPYSRERHLAELSAENVRYLAIEQSNGIAGFIILKLENDGAVEFRRIVVSDRGKGIGKQALDELENYCRKKLNAHRIWLDVFEDDARARHVYSSKGYEPTGTSSYAGKTLIIMAKAI